MTSGKRKSSADDAQMFKLDRGLITMSAEGFKAFMEELDSPAKPVPEMVEFLRRKAPWERD
jgi:uncharacterized protein (DUF1778 family)